MDNYNYFVQAVEGLPPQVSSPAEWDLLQEALGPRMHNGFYDLGDGTVVSFFEEGTEYGLRIENPDLPTGKGVGFTMDSPVGRVEEFYNDRKYRTAFTAANNLAICRIHWHSGSLRYLILEYLKFYPPRHERERRRAAELEETKMRLESVQKDLTKSQRELGRALEDLASARRHIERLTTACQKAAAMVDATRRFIKDRRFANIRIVLEEAIR